MTPKFTIGEMAILRSPHYPVMTVSILVARYSDQWMFALKRTAPPGYGYKVSGIDLVKCEYIAELELHKIPPLSDQSFSEIMEGLNQPEPVTQ